jgi:starvation-inducible DNA-binding protein
VSGLHIRDYHLLLHEQATQILATTDIIAERLRKLGGQTINSIGHIGRLEQIQDNNAAEVAPREMSTELLEDNRLATEQMRKMHALCDERGDVMSASLIENRINGAEGRAWLPLEDINSGK